MFDGRVEATTDFSWTHVFECEVNRHERTRIWCEPSITPNNAFKSNKIASSFLAQRTADLAVALLAQGSEQTIVMVNVRDAYMATLIPASAQSGCIALTDTADNQRVGQMVLDFYGRSDVLLRRFVGVPEIRCSAEPSEYCCCAFIPTPLPTMKPDAMRCYDAYAV